MIVTSHGIIIVDKKSVNRMDLPLKFKNEKAYAERLDVRTWLNIIAVDTIKLFKIKRTIGNV